MDTVSPFLWLSTELTSKRPQQTSRTKGGLCLLGFILSLQMFCSIFFLAVLWTSCIWWHTLLTVLPRPDLVNILLFIYHENRSWICPYFLTGPQQIQLSKFSAIKSCETPFSISTCIGSDYYFSECIFKYLPLTYGLLICGKNHHYRDFMTGNVKSFCDVVT